MELCHIPPPYVKSIARHLRCGDRRVIPSHADHVIKCTKVSGMQCVGFDDDIPSSMLGQRISETTDPAGLFKALRAVPVFLAMLRDVEGIVSAGIGSRSSIIGPTC
jgi:alpha-galactosidase/6-phospho-beta-glucosidase family protein